MQGKGIVKFFLVVMALVTAVQYMLILPTRKVEKNADSIAQAASSQAADVDKTAVYKAARIAYLDSISSEVVFSIPYLKSYTYQELKAQQLALGLDLKGGMSVVLQVDLKGFLIALSNDSKDPSFIAALDQANLDLRTSQSDYITLFAEAFRSLNSGKNLASIFARNEALRDQINFETTDGEIVRILRDKANETVDLTFKLLKERIDKLGVTQPNVSLDQGRDLIIVELPGIDNPERARSFLQAAAKLEFRNVYRILDAGIQNAFVEANQKLSATEGVVTEPTIVSIDTIFALDDLGNEDRNTIVSIDTTFDQNAINSGPLFDALAVNVTGNLGLAVMGVAQKNKKGLIEGYLSRREIKALFPPDVLFRWSKDPIKDNQSGQETDQYELYAIRLEKGTEKAPLSGDHVTDARAQPDPMTNEVTVSLKMDNTGAKIWGQLTTKAAQDNNREIAILLDDEVVSAPRVINPITSGDSQITGSFSIQEAKDLANILQVGKLPAETQIRQESLVGPSLGQDNINKSMIALIIGFSVVLIFMVIYYGGAGIFSILALLLNLIFIFAGLASFGTVLTLPGIAGVVLTIGMAVDANVIIFERVREELRDGKSMLMAIQDGFANSYSAIIDANVTTLLTAFVLAYFGLGPIKGFAVVLIIGVLFSLFTAVLVGRLMIDSWTKSRTLSFSSKATESAFSNLSIDWLGKRKIAYGISGIIIVLGIVSFLTRGFDLGVDFKGGYSYNITFDSKVTNAEDLRNSLTTVFEGKTPIVKVVDTDNTFNVVTDYLIDDEGTDAADKVMLALYNGVNSLAGGNVNFEDFKNPDGIGTHVTSSSKVGATIADDIKVSAFYAAIFSLLLIFLYIFIRFSKWQYSMGAVAALFHDTLVVLSLFSLLHGFVPFSLEIDQAFIAAILTVIGYSINDTVVIFDRIREFLNIYNKSDKNEVINKAINSTVSRTIITSLTTLFVITILFVFGGSSIKGFAFALLVGVIVGTYSSVFIATPVLSDLSKDLKVKVSNDKRKGFSKAVSKAG